MKIIKFSSRIFAVFSALLIALSFCTEAFAAPADVSNNVLTVGVDANRCPITYVDPDTGEIVGIGADVLRSAAENAGMEISFVQIKEKNMKEALDNEAYDMLMPFGSAIQSPSSTPAFVSESLFDVPFATVTKKGNSVSDISELHVGMLSYVAGLADTFKQMYPDMQITFYDSTDECVKALRKGEVDALLNNSYIWSIVLQKPSYSDLSINTYAAFKMDYRVGAPDTPENRTMIEQLNKGIGTLNDAQRQAIILDYTSRRLYKYELGDYFYKYWPSIVLFILVVVGVVFIVVQRKLFLRKQQDEKLRKLIDEDSLTGALSIKGFRKRVTELLTENRDKAYLLLYVNISNFKFINDSEGMEAGDDLLRFVVNKTKEILREDEAICRLEGDHFAILRRLRKEEKVREEYDRVITAVRNFFIDKGKEKHVRLFCGIYVLVQEDYEKISVDHMIDLARVAEKRVRRSPKKEGYEFYNHDQWVKGKRSSEITGHLSTAIKAEEIQVWYQPQVDFITGKINGAEALCRWEHPTLGWISPGEFIPVLEEAGLIRELDYYVWECVCKDLQKWNSKGVHRTVSVNLSRSDISDVIDIPEHFSDLVKMYDLTPDQIRIEITETVYAESPEVLIETTKALKERGFTVEMDDFGSGYSSLNILKEVPVDVIKLDLMFLRESDHPEKSRTIIRHIVKMVKELGMELIAEGVETEEQAAFLKSQGCSEMQGYYFYKPLPRHELENVIKTS